MKSNQNSKGLQVRTDSGQKVIEKLRTHQLLDLTLKISQAGEFLFIPILAEPQPELFDDIPMKLVIHSFELRDLKPKSIKEYLSDKVPIDLIEFIPSSFDQIGDIVIVEIHEEFKEYKHVVGKAIMTVHSSVKSVYMKKSAVNGLVRTRMLEFLTGNDDPLTIHKEYGLRIAVNIKEIYFSPRLSTEHFRIANMISNPEIILDMFGGCAPFSFHVINQSPSKCTTIDINPVSEELIYQTKKLNPSLKGEITAIVGDAEIIGKELLNQGLLFDRIIMNHPSDSLRFLDLATKLAKPDGIIHFYLFAPILDHEAYCNQLIDTNTSGCTVEDIHIVRQYSPQEYHTCISICKLE